MPKSRSPRATAGRLYVDLSESAIRSLRSRGAQGDRSHGPLGYTSELVRSMTRYDHALAQSDPRRTFSMPEAQYELILELLGTTETFDLAMLDQLGTYLQTFPGFAQRVQEVGVAPRWFGATVDGLPYAEKAHLWDAAQRRAAAGRRGEE